MIVIISEINGSQMFDSSHMLKLKSEFDSLDVEMLIYVYSDEELLQVLRENKYKNFIVFSNFPPNSSYPGSGKKMNYKDEGSELTRSWEADSYSMTKGLFEDICSKYKILEIHFLTGAPVQMVSDEFIKSVSQTARITITRKKQLIDSGLDFHQTYCNYIVETVKGFVLKGPFM